MIKIATPISNFFFNKNAKEIYNHSDCLEAREFSYFLEFKKIHLIHFDIDLIIEWDINTKNTILKILKKLKNKKLITFQCSKRCSGNKIVNGKYELTGKIYNRNDLIRNSVVNTKWLRKHL